MKLSEAAAIFDNIENPALSDEAKGYAIYVVLNKFVTHNSITKKAMLAVIRWLFNKVFEIEEGTEQNG